MKKLNFVLTASVLLLTLSCKQEQKKNIVARAETQKTDIVSAIIEDKENFYHIDFNSYPSNDTSLPIGVFDSGTGGLTVLKAIVNYDENNNESFTKGGEIGRAHV